MAQTAEVPGENPRSSGARAKLLSQPACPRDVRSHWVYMLRCSDGSLYTGYTVDLERRLENHSAGRGSKFTRSRLPVELAYSEEGTTLSWALKREHEIKKLSRRDKLLLCSANRGLQRKSSR